MNIEPDNRFRTQATPPPPRNPFAGLRVAITGGTSGLGLALVRELRHRGSRVAFVARGRDAVRRAASEHADVYGIVGDVSKKEDIYPIAVQILGGLGGLDVLINNASHLGPTPWRCWLTPTAKTSSGHSQRTCSRRFG
jgi:NAD(P)-dependent dehydrogenase (short-subunit alcohol dehydrogenase family)